MRLTRKVFINRDVTEVFAYLASPGAEPRWRSSVIESISDEPGGLREGSRGRNRMRFMGREVVAPWEIVEFVRDSRLCRGYASRVRGGRDRYLLQRFGIGATVLELRVEVEASGLMGLLITSRRTAMESELRADLRRLKAILESSASIRPR